MPPSVTKLPVRTAAKEAAPNHAASPATLLDSLRREIDHLFEGFGRTGWRSPFRGSAFDVEPFWRHDLSFGTLPAVDIAEKDKAYEIEAELPGMDDKNIEISLSEGMLTIKGEKREEKEEKKKNYYLSERHYGSFQRAFRLPAGVDTDKVEASFSKGVLKVTLPKTTEAQRKERKIEVKAA